MNWNSSNLPLSDRIFGALPYLLPLVDMFLAGYERPLLESMPWLQIALAPLLTVAVVYAQFVRFVPFGGTILFFVLFFAVVRNERVSRYIRFNTMQAILIDIILILCNLILPIVGKVIPSAFVLETLLNTVFLGIVAVFCYATIRASQGQDVELPGISEAVDMQVR
jgi:uncharacterized membrane protein